MMKKVLSFSGSNSSTSINNQLVRFAGKQLEDVTYLSLRELDVPLYSEDEEKKNGIPEGVIAFFDQIQVYDAFIIATPEHNGGLPAFFKNILDWLSRHNREVFGGKPVVVLATSPGANGAKSALGTLGFMLGHFSAVVKGQFSLDHFYDNFDLEKGEMQDVERAKELVTLLSLL